MGMVTFFGTGLFWFYTLVWLLIVFCVLAVIYALLTTWLDDDPIVWLFDKFHW